MHHNVQLTIEPLQGGFVLSYPVEVTTGLNYTREVFTSQRKMNLKIKELLEKFSTTPNDAA